MAMLIDHFRRNPQHCVDEFTIRPIPRSRRSLSTSKLSMLVKRMDLETGQIALAIIWYVFSPLSVQYSNFFQNDIPGPGYYSSSAPGLAKEGPSLSKKGYSNAFLSKRSRLESVVMNTNVAGPGYYDPKPVPDIYRTSRGAFPESTAERMPYEDVKKKVKPGPGDYHIDKTPGLPKYLQQKPSSSFVSNSTRNPTTSNKSALIPHVTVCANCLRFVPGPASYCPNVPTAQQKIIWSKYALSPKLPASIM